MERMTKNEKRVLFLRCFAKLILFAEKNDIEFLVICFNRTLAEQKRLVKAGKSWTLNSKHLLWRAQDIAILKRIFVAGKPLRRVIDWQSKNYATLGIYWETLHPLCVWGGRWKQRDSGHLEIK